MLLLKKNSMTTFPFFFIIIIFIFIIIFFFFLMNKQKKTEMKTLKTIILFLVNFYFVTYCYFDVFVYHMYMYKIHLLTNVISIFVYKTGRKNLTRNIFSLDY